jgi:hypothetical protein
MMAAGVGTASLSCHLQVRVTTTTTLPWQLHSTKAFTFNSTEPATLGVPPVAWHWWVGVWQQASKPAVVTTLVAAAAHGAAAAAAAAAAACIHSARPTLQQPLQLLPVSARRCLASSAAII